MAFNWDDHPEVKEEPVAAPKAEGKTAFNWNDHPVAEESNTPVSDKIADTLSKGADLILPSIDKVKVAAQYLPDTVANPLINYLNTAKDAGIGMQEGATLGLRDELIGGAKGLGKTALESITGEIPRNKSALEELHDNYRKYQKQAQDEQDAAHSRGYAAKVGQLAGGIATGGLGLNSVTGLARKALVGAGLGGLTGAGESKDNIDSDPTQVAKDTAYGAGLGAASVPIGEGIAKYAVTPAINKAMNYFGNSTSAKQIAAATLNAANGGSVFGESGPSAITDQSNQLAKNTAEKLGQGIPEKNADFGTAFAKADNLGKTLEKPSASLMDSITDLTDSLGQSKSKLSPQDADAISQLYEGTLPPSKAYNLIQSLKEQRSRSFNDIPLKNSLDRVIGDLTNSTNDVLGEGALQNLNTAKSTAWSQVEPLLQKSQQIVPDPNFQPTDASDLSGPQRNLKIQNLMNYWLKTAGTAGESGDKSRLGLGELQNHLKDIGMTGVNFPGVNPSEIASDLQNQSYLNAAKQSVQGIKPGSDLDVGKLNPITNFIKKGALHAAEKLSGSDIAQDVSSKLLSKDPATMLENARALGNNPKTAALAKQYYDAAQVNDKQKLTNIAFQVMQNPKLKEALGAHSNVSTSIPGVVNSDKEQ